MRDRVAQLVGPVGHRMWVSTFHAACSRILRREASLLGYRSSFTIYDQADATRLTDWVRRDLNLDPKRFPARQLHAPDQRAEERADPARASTRSRPSARPSAASPRCTPSTSAGWPRRRPSTSTTCSCSRCACSASSPKRCDRYQQRFRHVLVDEFQDTNAAQWEIVRLLAVEHRSIMVVGDDAQSVYKFRGADFRNLLKFEDAFPDATIVVLDQNYRSTQRILEAANAVIANNASTRKKHLWTDKGVGEQIVRYQGDDEHDEAAFVVREIHRLVDGAEYRYGDVAVFYRTNAQSRVLEESLVRSGVPYRVFGGVKFYDRREIKDALGVSARAREPRRRGVVEARRQHAAARRGRHVDRQARLVRAGRGRHRSARRRPRPRPRA